MKLNPGTLLLLGGLTLAACNQKKGTMTDNKEQLTPPTAEKIKKELTEHGDTRIDNYYWMNDREDPKVIAYLQAENKYLDTIMEPYKKLRGKLFDEMKGRIMETDISAPY